MFSVTYAQLNAWLTAFLWPFVRILALVATAPWDRFTFEVNPLKVGQQSVAAVDGLLIVG